jgi:hypothetical protein
MPGTLPSRAIAGTVMMRLIPPSLHLSSPEIWLSQLD